MAKKKQASKDESGPQRKRRSVDQLIADLEAKIVAIRTREAQRKAKTDPSLRHAKTALRALEKALAATKDGTAREAFEEARSALGSYLSSKGLGRGSATRIRRTATEIENLSDTLLNYVRSNPGQRGEQIAEALATDTKTMRPVMKRLIENGKIATEGQRRGMTYTAV